MSLYISPKTALLTHDTELLANMDPYVQVKIDGEKKRTRADKGGGKKPKWNQVLIFKFKNAPHSSKMRIKIYDQQRFVDDLVGVVDVPLAKYIQNHQEHEQKITLQYKGKQAGVLQMIIRYTPNTSVSQWSSSQDPNNNSGWSFGGNSSKQNFSDWGPNNNGWNNNSQGSKSGW